MNSYRMDDIITQYNPLVHRINATYEQLHALSDDDLRAESMAIAQTIGGSVDNCQTEHLVRTFAIAKETARRLTEGSLCVIANSLDRRMAENYDFVRIEGDRAIYKNRWYVGGVPMQWNMIHYDEQLLGGILLHYGYAVEMATGEGKTLVATLPVLLNALTHEGVHLMTSNAYLSKRDFEITRPLYAFHGLTTDCIECYSPGWARKEAYRADITFGTSSSFTFDYLRDHMTVSPEKCMQQNHCFAIVDEIDSALIDEADTPHLIGDGDNESDGKVYTENLALVKEALSHPDFYTVDRLRKKCDFTLAGKRWLAEKTGIPDLFHVNRTYEVPNFKSLSTDAQHDIMKRLTLQNVLRQLLRALTVCERDVDYIVSSDSVVIIDPHTGRAKTSNRWDHGLHTAVEVKEQVKVNPDFDEVAVISLKNYLRLYKKVAGMSGTILPVADELAELYGLKCAVLPTHRPVIRIDHPLRIFRTTALKDKAVVNAILANREVGRPTLVGNTSIKRAEAIDKLLDAKGVAHNKLNAKSDEREALVVAGAGIGATITVATSMAGRGTDIKPSPDAIAAGGLMVIGTDLFDSVRVDLQLKGRSGRQGNPGSSAFFASLDDHILGYLSDEDMEGLKRLATSIDGDELSCPEVLHYFEKAQANCEAHFRELRKETARKDDIVAPHRLKFYNQRNAVLFDAAASDAVVEEVASASRTPAETIDEHLRKLYLQSLELARRVTSNNPDLAIMPIPYSVRQQPFAVRLHIKRMEGSLSYFKGEFKRQVILRTYDSYWRQFVLHMMEDLDEKEVAALEGEYQDMMADVRRDILDRLLHSSILFDGRNISTTPKQPRHETPPVTNNEPNMLDREAPCPCGSGKKYGECHGRAIAGGPKPRRRDRTPSIRQFNQRH